MGRVRKALVVAALALGPEVSESIAANAVDAIPARRLWRSLLVGSALSLAVCCAVVAQLVIVGSTEGGWHYPYAERDALAAFTLIVGCVLWSAGAMALLLMLPMPVPRSGARPLLLLLPWIIVATGLQWPLRSMAPSSLESVFVSDNANSFYSVTRQHEPAEVLRRFSRVQAHAPLHVQSNMPGKLMLLYALQRVSSRPDVLPWLIIGLSNLGAILVYLFVRDLFDDSRTAFIAGVLYLFVPARHFFFPLLNTVTPIAVLTCGWLLVRWLRTGATVYPALMGLGLYGLVFFEPLPLVMGLLFLALVLGAIGRGEVAWDRFIGQTAVLIFIFIVTSETVEALSGFDAVRTFRSIGTHAVEFNESTGRPYWVWVRANLWEFLFGVGFCQATSFGVLLWAGLRGAGRWRERVTRPITALCLGLLAVLIAVDVIGVNRGEVIRLWIFLACFFQIPAAYVCATLDRRTAVGLVLGTTALQAAVGVAMIRFVIP
jgi:hypothetical protein